VDRPDLIQILSTAVTNVSARFGAEVVGASSRDGCAAVSLADGSTIEADVVVGADGIHSRVRDAVFGPSVSRFARLVAYRALVPREAVADLAVEVTNRMGPHAHIVSYFVGESQQYLNLVCVVPEALWDVEGWNEPGSIDDLRAHFAGWAPDVCELLRHVIEPVHRWALYDREPTEIWTSGRVTLLGDACHPMLPFTAQGACQAVEDAAILSRLLTETDADGVEDALACYERIRRPRTAKIQKQSRDNANLYHMADGPDQAGRDAFFSHLGGGDSTDVFDWLYGYDALTVDLG